MNSPVTSLDTQDEQYGLSSAHITGGRLLRSEWTKLWSTRSLWITLALAFGLVLGIGTYLILDGRVLNGDAVRDVPFGFTSIHQLGMIVLVILGVLTIAGEYGTGSIRTTMIAAPRRTGAMLAKATVITAVTAALGMLTTVLLYAVLQLAGTVPVAQGMSLFDPAMFWGALGGTVILPYGALLGFVLGGLARNAAAAICLYFGVIQMGPQLLSLLLPERWTGLLHYTPLPALEVIRAGGTTTEPYGVGVAIIVALSWLAALGGLTWWLLRVRDV